MQRLIELALPKVSPSRQTDTFYGDCRALKKRITLIAALGVCSGVMADGSPWLPAHGSTTLSVDVTSGSTEQFFIGDESTDLGGELEGTYVWFNAKYGYDDIWAFDIRTGYAETGFGNGQQERDDITDTSIGVSYQFNNEFEADNGSPTISARLGYTVGGDYETNVIDSIGDGASGFDASLLVGKSITPSIALFGDLSYRQRGSGVADGVKYLLSAYYTSPIAGLGFQVAAAGIRTDSNLDIDSEGFSFERFSQTNRDTDMLILGANYGFTNGVGIGFSFSNVLSGRNVADTNVATFSASYSF